MESPKDFAMCSCIAIRVIVIDYRCATGLAFMQAIGFTDPFTPLPSPSPPRPPPLIGVLFFVLILLFLVQYYVQY